MEVFKWLKIKIFLSKGHKRTFWEKCAGPLKHDPRLNLIQFIKCPIWKSPKVIGLTQKDKKNFIWNKTITFNSYSETPCKVPANQRLGGIASTGRLSFVFYPPVLTTEVVTTQNWLRPPTLKCVRKHLSKVLIFTKLQFFHCISISIENLKKLSVQRRALCSKLLFNPFWPPG